MKYVILIVGIILTIIGLVLIFKKEKVITEIEYIHYSFSTGTMKDSYVYYDLNCKKECILKYKPDLEPEENEEEYKVDKKDVKRIEELLKKYNVGSWDGFDKYDSNVLDGDSFTFNVKCKDGTKIDSHGYMMYPKNYRDVTNEFIKILSKYTKK